MRMNGEHEGTGRSVVQFATGLAQSSGSDSDDVGGRTGFQPLDRPRVRANSPENLAPYEHLLVQGMTAFVKGERALAVGPLIKARVRTLRHYP